MNMSVVDYHSIVSEAWSAYDSSRSIVAVEDVSAMVSTNHVYKATLDTGRFVIAKLSYFGQYEHFVEDHTIINVLSNNLPFPFENFLSRALMTNNGLFVHRYNDAVIDAWVIFYRPVRIKNKLPRKLDLDQVGKLATEFAKFHKACFSIRNTLPSSSKVMISDLNHLLRTVHRPVGQLQFGGHEEAIKNQCRLFQEAVSKADLSQMPRIPVFVDWNIGNFSVNSEFLLYSRWDYDWFRMSTRMLDFYFFSRVVSSAGDQTVFSYLIDPLTEERFIHFLKVYHAVYPLNRTEILFLKEVYRFFILHYVIHFGSYFFQNRFAKKLQEEAFSIYLPSIDQFDATILLNALKL